MPDIQLFGGLGKKRKACHSEGAFCPRNVLFPRVQANCRFLASPACRRQARNDNTGNFADNE